MNTKKKFKKIKNKTKKSFLYNPNDPTKSFDVYIDKNPSDTIPIKYTTVKDVEDTIKKLEKLYKEGKYSHKRIWQVGMIMKVRLGAMKKYKKTKYPNAKDVTKRFNLANKYFKFLGKRTKIKGEEERKKLNFG
jgi:benzoyl-CoA reductase/2-hydroxyglutaryl-CoA dehydratase subunit BcrC/BadD/HgdB